MKPNLMFVAVTLLFAAGPAFSGDEDGSAKVIYVKRFNEDHVALFNAEKGTTTLGKYTAKDEDSGFIYTSQGTSFYKRNASGNGGAIYQGGAQKGWAVDNDGE